MLAFLDSLCGALIARDTARIRRLLSHPLARALPRAVREEAFAIASGTRRGYPAPVQALRLYHQTAHLLGVTADPAMLASSRSETTAALPRQMELPLEPTAIR